MGALKYITWAAGGLAAVVAAPLTGGGSIALLLGAAGTTTLGGVALGVSGGLVAKKLYDECTDDTEEKMKAYQHEAETNKAGWQQSESKRQQEAQLHKEEMELKNTNLTKLLKDREGIIQELRQQKFSIVEAELMFTLASAAAHVDGNASDEELEAASKAISLLCVQPDEALNIGREIFKQKISIDDAMEKIRKYSNSRTLNRLSFVLDMVIYADGYIDPKEQELLDVFNDYAKQYVA